MLGTDWPQVQKTWLHRLGNLTLTGYNPNYSDQGIRGKEGDRGWDSIKVRYGSTRTSARHRAGRPKEMEARGRRLADQALRIWPRLDADEAMIRAMELEELKAKGTTAQRLAGTDEHRSRGALRGLCARACTRRFPNVIEAAERKSVSYHDPEFFLEVIPRKYGLVLVIDLDFNEVDAERWAGRGHV